MALTYGSRGADVLDLQKKMAAAGFNPGPLDGIWGDKTQNAYSQYSAGTQQAAQTLAPQTNPLADLVGFRDTAEGMGGQVGWSKETGPTLNGAKVDTSGMINKDNRWYGKESDISKMLATTKAPEYQTGGGMFKPEDMQGLIQKILSPDAFSYDPNTDPAYQSILARYTQEGDKAFNNNMADLTAATGGRLNSWAAGQASQARNNMVGQANDSIPDLMQIAYGMYADKQKNNYNALGALSGLDETMYGRSRDAYGDMKSNANTALDLDNMEYEKGLDSRNYDRDVFESDRSYNRDVLESNRSYSKSISGGKTKEPTDVSEMGTTEQVSYYNGLLNSFTSGKYSGDPAAAYARLLNNRSGIIDLTGEKLYNQLVSDIKGLDTVMGAPKSEPGAPAPKATDYKMNPGFAEDMADVIRKDFSLDDVQSNSEALIKAYGVDGYNMLVKVAKGDAASLEMMMEYFSGMNN